MTTTERLQKWRSKNADRVLRRPVVDHSERGRIAADLESRGIAITRFDELFPSDLWGELLAESGRLRSAHHNGPSRVTDVKPFKARLLENPLRLDSVFARIAMDPGLLQVVAHYLGMRPLLRALQIWLTFPTAGPPVETQLWHRDGDDVMNVKLFIYLTDVTERAGPFCFAPRTHPVGPLRRDADSDPRGRSEDAEMAAVLPESEWLVCTGEAGTVILADTCGYHKQLKPRGDERMLLMAQYTSGKPAYPPDLRFVVDDPASLTLEQRAALDP